MLSTIQDKLEDLVFRNRRLLQAYRRLQFFDSFDMDSVGAVVGFQRNFTENVSIGI